MRQDYGSAPLSAADFGLDATAGFGGRHGRHGGHSAVHAIVAQHHHQMSKTAQREALMDPNKGSKTNIERYSFAINCGTYPMGVAATWSGTRQPNAGIRPQRVLYNAASAYMFYITYLQVANVNVFVGDLEDAFTYGPGSMGVMLDLPTVKVDYRVSTAGTYSGNYPNGLNGIGEALPNMTFIATVQGPADMVGGQDSCQRECMR